MSIYKSGWLTTPESKLARRDDPDTSKDAADKVAGKLGKMQQYVLELVEQAGERGTTIKEMQVLAHPEKRPSSISSRPNELHKRGLIYYEGKRDGCRVIKLIKYRGVTTETANEDEDDSFRCARCHDVLTEECPPIDIGTDMESGVYVCEVCFEGGREWLQAEVIETMTLKLMKEHYAALMHEDVGNGLQYKEANERMARLFIGKNQWEKHKETIWQWFDDTHGEKPNE